MSKRGHGQPTKCTQEVIDGLAECVQHVSIERACELLEICEKTYHNWKNRGEKGEEPYVYFLQSIKKAEAERSQRRLKRIEKCAKDRITFDKFGNKKITKGDWQALAWLEERQNRKEFSRNLSKFILNEVDQGLSEMQQLNALSTQILKRMSAGEMSAEEAALASQVIKDRQQLLFTADMEKRLEELEGKNK